MSKSEEELISELTADLTDAGDNLYLDDQGNWMTTTPMGEEVPNQWMWGEEGLIPLGGRTRHDITPFMEIREQYRGGGPIEAETWEDAVRKSIEGFMRVIYAPDPTGVNMAEARGRWIEPDFLFDAEQSANNIDSQFRMGTLLELMQDPTISGVFTDTPAARMGYQFITPEQYQAAVTGEGIQPEDIGRPGWRWEGTTGPSEALGGALAAAGIQPNEEITPEQWERLSPEQQSIFLEWFTDFVPPSRGDDDFDPLWGLSPSDKLLVFEDVPTSVDIEKMFGPMPDFIVKGGGDEDFNDYIIKLAIDEYAPPPEVIKATPESVLAKMFDLPQYRLAFGNDPDVLDPTASPAERFRADPGYQFAQDEGMRNIQRNAAAKGLLESGKTMRDLQTFGQGLADQNYQRFLAQNLGIYGDWQNQLRGLASQGAGLSSQLAQQTLGVGNTQAGLNSQLASNLGSLFGNQGSMGASAFLNTGGAQANTVMQAASLQAQIAAANAAAQNTANMMGGGGGGGGGFGSALSALGSLF